VYSIKASNNDGPTIARNSNPFKRLNVRKTHLIYTDILSGVYKEGGGLGVQTPPEMYGQYGH